MPRFRAARFAQALLLAGAYEAVVCAQSVTEFDIGSPTSPTSIVRGSDGNFWFAEVYAYSIGRITPAGAITHFPLPNYGVPSFLTLGPDGNVWFTETGASLIGRIDASGVIDEFPAYPGPHDYLTRRGPRHITSGPDGALWFADAEGPIGRITTDGIVTEIPASDSASAPSGIAFGADGNLWFTELQAARVARMTPSGAVTRYDLPPYTQPNSITAGPDGNLWFTDQALARVGRITTDGVITLFPKPLLYPLEIVTGPDGNLWFSEFDEKVGRITPAGVITEFPLPALFGSYSYGIASGPDGNLWVTRASLSGARITRFTPPASTSSASSFYALSPCRVLDTRDPAGPFGGPALPAQTARAVTMSGACGVPSSATSVVANVTVTQPSEAGYLNLYAGGLALPATTVLSYRAGQTRANSAIIGLGTAGDLQIWCGQSAGTAHAIIDVSGYFR